MTREEEVIKASHLYAKHQQKPFVDGAKWADKTMIEKACEWLQTTNLDYYQIIEGVFSTDLVKDFKKAMEE